MTRSGVTVKNNHEVAGPVRGTGGAARRHIGHVQVSVWRYALAAQDFTADEIAEKTGHNKSSVHSELERLKDDDLITMTNTHRQVAGRGRPAAVYAIVADPEKRLELSRRVSQYYSAPSDRVMKPTCPEYREAISRIDNLHMKGERCAQNARNTRMLMEAQALLDEAAEEEGWVNAPESVQTYLAYERARLAYLRRDDVTARQIFASVQGRFQSYRDELYAQWTRDYLELLTTANRPSPAATLREKMEAFLHLVMGKAMRGPIVTESAYLLSEALAISTPEYAVSGLSADQGTGRLTGSQEVAETAWNYQHVRQDLQELGIPLQTATIEW